MSENIYRFGITTVGYNPKPIDVVEEEGQLLLKQFFGSSVDLEQTSPLWRLVQVNLVQIAQLWIQSEANFYSEFIQTAVGIGLDLLGKDISVERLEAVEAGSELKIIKNTSSAVTVPEGSLFQTGDGIIFATVDEITIIAGDPATTFGTVDAVALIAGINGNVSSASITIPTNAISGVDSSTNDSPASGGEDRESDEDYRKRLYIFVRSTWTASAISTAAQQVDGVSGVKIEELATSYNCLIVPTVSFISELQAAVESTINRVTPITVEYSVIEAISVRINVESNIILGPGYDQATAEQEAGLQISSYFATLGIDDDVLLAKIIQAIMNVSGIENAWNVVIGGEVIGEKHTFVTGTDVYSLDYSSIDVVETLTGTLSGSPHTFIKDTDFQVLSSPARIDWSLGGDDPDNGTDFAVSYKINPDAIGDVEIQGDKIAVFNDVEFTVM